MSQESPPPLWATDFFHWQNSKESVQKSLVLFINQARKKFILLFLKTNGSQALFLASQFPALTFEIELERRLMMSPAQLSVRISKVLWALSNFWILGVLISIMNYFQIKFLITFCFWNSFCLLWKLVIIKGGLVLVFSHEMLQFSVLFLLLFCR